MTRSERCCFADLFALFLLAQYTKSLRTRLLIESQANGSSNSQVPKLGIAPNYLNAWRLSAKSTTVGIIQSSKVVVVVNITYARLQKKTFSSTAEPQ